MLNLSNNLYYQLPELYRKEDSRLGLPLQRYLSILGSGMDYAGDKIWLYTNVFDLDKCPVELLPLFAEMMGLPFPYSMPEHAQRRFLKALPFIYRMKGTEQTFKYLAREIFGAETKTDAFRQQYTEGMLPAEWRKIFVRVETIDQPSLQEKITNFNRLSEYIRPANRNLITELSLVMLDQYDTNRWKEEELQYLITYILIDLEDYVWDKVFFDLSTLLVSDTEDGYNNTSEIYDLFIPSVFDTESIGAPVASYEMESIFVSVETEAFTLVTNELLAQSTGINSKPVAKLVTGAGINHFIIGHFGLPTTNH